jgi:ATP-binding cassette, subfamily C (CFTR/MRP), member 4
MKWEDQNKNSTLPLESAEDFLSWSWMDKDWAIYIYTAIICATLFLAIFRSYLFFNVCMRASVNLHDSMFSSIIRTTIAFFSENPTGKTFAHLGKQENRL